MPLRNGIKGKGLTGVHCDHLPRTPGITVCITIGIILHYIHPFRKEILAQDINKYVKDTKKKRINSVLIDE